MEPESRNQKLILTIALGAMGGLFVMAISRVVLPRLMTRMMKTMMSQMMKDGCNPSEI